MASRLWIWSFVFVLSVIVPSFAGASASENEDSQSKEFVLTLDHSNFFEIVAKHDFIVVDFYAPWCYWSKKLAPEYEKAASVLSLYDPRITLAKVDASEEKNQGIARKFKIQGYPTIKILRNGGNHYHTQEYYGPRDADDFVAYLIKERSPASGEIKSTEDFNIEDRYIEMIHEKDNNNGTSSPDMFNWKQVKGFKSN
ncbi:hypothetical protein HYC85_019955 [Camellia sinensis]|uniref:protein disulfide-isomerase n=1 Tax=Camellia sinensis TaxID=4442 RepID=A0A7J7GNF3_CAMSI|nr:hypothetical protein HYC85_019955 [Camellia sinensis]